VSDASRFIPSLASALNIKEAEGRGFRDGITSVIADKRALLVLDNLEQIITSAVDIADLVSTCPNLKILTTSRMPLKISAEQEYPLEPLSLPERSRLASLEEALASPAVALFADRAKKANHRFQMTLDNAPAVAEICHRLDGLPLAIELAAAKARFLSPESLLMRLTDTLDVLSQGPRDLPERHQTLRATIDWSHTLLSDGEKTLFRRLSVFSGGFTLEGAEAVCLKEDRLVSFDVMASLLEQCLVRRQGTEDRYILLQTIKEYALEKLEDTGELAKFKRNHARYFLDVAKRIHQGTQGKDQLAQMEVGDREEANLQSALDWSLAGAEGGDEEAGELGLQICGELWMYWHIRGMHISARGWIDKLLEATGGHRPTPGVSAALLTAGLCSWTLGHYPRAVEELTASYRMAEELDLSYIVAASSGCLAIAYLPLGELELAAKYVRESIDTSRKKDYEWMLGFSLAFDGLISFVGGDLQGAREKYYQGLEIQRRIRDYEGGGFSLGGLAQLAAVIGDHQEAIKFYKDALASYVRVGDRAEEARIFEEMAWTYLKMEETGKARHNFLDSIEAYKDVGSVRGIGLALLGLSAAEQVEGSAFRAVQLAAAAKRFTEEEGIVNVYMENNPAQDYLDGAQIELTPEKILEAEGKGRLLSVDEALKFAMGSA
jgi:predicted ATPase